MTPRTVGRLLIAGLLIAGCTRSSPHEEEAEGGKAAPIAVKTAAVRRGAIDDVLAATGETRALSSVRLASPIAGRLTWIDVQPGDAIQKGAVVARVISLENEAAVNGLDLLRRSGASSSDLAGLRKDLGSRDVPVRSPISGRASARLRSAGEQVAAGDVLIEVFDPTTLFVVAEVAMTAVARIAHGLDVEVTGADFSSKGTVDAVVPAATATTLTIPVRITLAERPRAGVMHEPVRVRIWLAKQRPALLAPRASLISSGAGTKATVVVAKDGRAEVREIEVGARTDEEIEIVSGLAADERVVTEGAYGLADGAALALEASGAERPAGKAQ